MERSTNQKKSIIKIIASGVLMVALLSVGGCKQQQQIQQQMESMDAKVTEGQKRISALESEIKKKVFYEITKLYWFCLFSEFILFLQLSVH